MSSSAFERWTRVWMVRTFSAFIVADVTMSFKSRRLERTVGKTHQRQAPPSKGELTHSF